MISFLVVGLGVYYGGISVLGLAPLDWAAPVWTGKHLGLVVAGLILGALAGLLGFAFSMTIEVRSERLNDLIIVLWQFLANGMLVWILTIGIAMSVSLGREEAKAAVLHFGAEQAVIHVLVIGSIVGLVQGIAFFIASIIRLPFVAYIIFCETVSLIAARIHYFKYGIEGKFWIVAGLIVPVLLMILARGMIERDRRQRRLITEQSL